MMLSLPEEWNYTTRGLAAICKEGVDAIGSALKELETAGYIVRSSFAVRMAVLLIPSTSFMSSHSQKAGYAAVRCGFTRYGKPGYGKTGYGKSPQN